MKKSLLISLVLITFLQDSQEFVLPILKGRMYILSIYWEFMINHGRTEFLIKCPSRLIPSPSLCLYICLFLLPFFLSPFFFFLLRSSFLYCIGLLFIIFIYSWQFPFPQVFNIVKHWMYMVFLLIVIEGPAATVWEVLKEQMLVMDHPQAMFLIPEQKLHGSHCCKKKKKILSSGLRVQHFHVDFERGLFEQFHSNCPFTCSGLLVYKLPSF